MLRAARSLFRYRALLLILTGRELKARYRGSVLGWVWSFVTPLLLVAVYTFVFQYVFAGGDRAGRPPHLAATDPYVLFLVCGLFPWIWIQTSLLEGAASLETNAGLIRKATFPAEVLPAVPVLANLVHFLLALPVVGAAFLVFHTWNQSRGGWAAFLLPAVVLLQLPGVAGATLGAAALNAHFKDFRDILSNLLTVTFYATPILYSLEAVAAYPTLQRVLAWNPLTPFVRGYQAVLFEGRVPLLEEWGAMALVSALAWVLGAALFDRLSETLVEAV
jgi:ABC-type polysaccharide/polyol phosphate export permease